MYGTLFHSGVTDSHSVTGATIQEARSMKRIQATLYQTLLTLNPSQGIDQNNKMTAPRISVNPTCVNVDIRLGGDVTPLPSFWGLTFLHEIN